MFVCLTASCVVRFGDRTSYRYRKQAFTLHLMFSCSLVLIKTCSYVPLSFKITCSYVLMSSKKTCSYVFPKTMFFCSLVSQKKHVLMFFCLSKKTVPLFFCLSKKHVLMFFCLSPKPVLLSLTALNFYQVAHNRIAHKQPLSRQPQVVVAQLYSAVA